MDKVKTPVDRRKHERYLAERQTITMLWPASSIVGRVVDISIDGLAFRYLASEKPQDRSSGIEIMLPQDRFSSGILPFRTVSDQKTPSFFGTLVGKQERRRSVEFGELTEDQRAKLASFIENYCWKIPE